jgi:hypothetical protein
MEKHSRHSLSHYTGTAWTRMQADTKLKFVVRPVTDFEAVDFGEERKSHSSYLSCVEIAVPEKAKKFSRSLTNHSLYSPLRQP